MMAGSILEFINAQPDPEDLEHGQAVIVTARWVLVACGLLLAVVAPASADELRIRVVLILGLAVVNFGLHTQILRGKPAADWVAYIATAADILVITALVVMQGGYRSDLYIFYFPAILALSVAFDRLLTLVYAGSTVVIYLLAGLATVPDGQAPYLLVRCIVLVAIAVCGQVYWGVEARRRRAVTPDQPGRLASDPSAQPVPAAAAAMRSDA